MSKELWDDGICKKCGSAVIETADCDLSEGKDYMNTCSSPSCPEFKWHSCYDDECLDYYEHL